jgi:hypothetical protein
MRAIAPVLAAIPADHDAVLDLHVWSAAGLGDPDAAERAARGLLNAAGFPRRLRRIVVAVNGPRTAATGYFTFRPRSSGASGYAEERPARGLHPMTAKRLELWRLGEFDLARLPSAEDVYLFHAVARANPGDERVFAIAEVRDVTPLATTPATSSACPTWNACCWRRSPASAASSPGGRPARGCTGTGWCCTSGRRCG